MALADTGGGAHTLATRLTLRRTALQHFADVCRLACWVGKADLAEAGARWAWRAAIPFMSTPLLRASIAAPLAHVADAVNLLGVGDVEFQVRNEGAEDVCSGFGAGCTASAGMRICCSCLWMLNCVLVTGVTMTWCSSCCFTEQQVWVSQTAFFSNC